MKALPFLLLAFATYANASTQGTLICQTINGKTMSYQGSIAIESRIYPTVYTVTDSTGLIVSTNLDCVIREQTNERPSIQSSGTEEVR